MISDIVMSAMVIPFAAVAGLEATSRGYSFFYWLFLSICITPLLTLCILAALPARSLDRRRAREAAFLDQLLAQTGRGAHPAAASPPVRSLGDVTTLR